VLDKYWNIFAMHGPMNVKFRSVKNFLIK